MATVYKFSDPGVPSYSFSTNAASQSHFDALKAVLKGCLVSGYGSKPAAGWELVSEGSNWLTLRNGSHSGYLHLAYFSSGSNSRVHVYTAASFTGVVSPPTPDGDGVISGPSVGNSLPHRLLIAQLAYGSAYHAWTVIADERSFVLSWACTSGGGRFTPSANAAVMSLYAGETTTGIFVSVGGVAQAAATGLTTRFDSSGMTFLTDPKSGLLLTAFSSGEVVRHSRMLDSPSTLTYLLPSPQQQLVPVNVFGEQGATEELTYAGNLRGCCALPSYSGVWCADLLRLLRPESDGNCFGVMESLPEPFSETGYEFYVRYNNASSSSGLITNHPDYWQ